MKVSQSWLYNKAGWFRFPCAFPGCGLLNWIAYHRVHPWALCVGHWEGTPHPQWGRPRTEPSRQYTTFTNGIEVGRWWRVGALSGFPDKTSHVYKGKTRALNNLTWLKYRKLCFRVSSWGGRGRETARLLCERLGRVLSALQQPMRNDVKSYVL